MSRSRRIRKCTKVVVVGDDAVGKTSMLMSCVTDKFPTDSLPTVFDLNFVERIVDSEPIVLELWDTAGGEDYERLRPLSYSNTDVFMICYSVASPTSLENVEKKWLPEIRHYWPNSPFMLVGTKSDLRKDEKSKAKGVSFVDSAHAEKKGIELGAGRVMECSAKTQDGLKDVFDEAARFALDAR